MADTGKHTAWQKLSVKTTWHERTNQHIHNHTHCIGGMWHQRVYSDKRFRPHYAEEIWKRNNERPFWVLCLRKNSGRKITWLCWRHRLRSKYFHPRENATLVFSVKFLRFEERIGKARLAYNCRNRAVFSNSSCAVRTGLRKPTSSRLTEGSNSTMPAKDSTTTPSQLGIHHHIMCMLLPCHNHIKAKARNDPAIWRAKPSRDPPMGT